MCIRDSYNIVVNVAQQNNVNLDSDQINKIVELLKQIAQQEYNYDDVKATLEQVEPVSYTHLKGAHVWIFFKKAIPAATARNFGFLLLDKGSTSINLKSFHYYDRMYPSQDVASSIGNLIALPLQGQALKNGNSAFVDENRNADVYKRQVNGHLQKWFWI